MNPTHAGAGAPPPVCLPTERRGAPPSGAARRWPRRGALGLLPWLAAAGASAPLPEPPLPTGTIPVLEVRTDGRSPTQAGAELGRLAKLRFPDLEQRWDRYLSGFISQEQFDHWRDERVAPLRTEGLDPNHRALVDGLAGVLTPVDQDRLGDGRLSVNELWLIQLIPDIGRVSNCSGFGVYGRRSATGGPLVGRNLDWPADDALRGLQAITRWVSDSGSVVSVGFAGLVGVLTGFNDRGLFLAHLDSPRGQPYQEYPRQRAIGFDLLRTLETRGQIVAAADLLRRSRYGFSHNILMADRTQVRVLEQPAGLPGSLRDAGSPTRAEMAWGHAGQIAVVNCFVLRASPSNCWSTKDRYRWLRLRELARFRPAGPRAGLPELRAIMLDRANGGYEIFNRETLQSMVFDPVTTDLYLYARAADGVSPAAPVMYRYAAASEPGPAVRSALRLVDSLWLVVAAIVAATLWVRWRLGAGSRARPKVS